MASEFTAVVERDGEWFIVDKIRFVLATTPFTFRRFDRNTRDWHLVADGAHDPFNS